MLSVLYDLRIHAPAAKVYRAITDPSGIDSWWTLECSGTPVPGAEYRLFFGAPHDWRARVLRSEPDRHFAFEMTAAMDDWVGTKVSFALVPGGDWTTVRFRHEGWATESEHFRISSYCWAMLLRLLKVYVERGEVLPHAQRALL